MTENLIGKGLIFKRSTCFSVYSLTLIPLSNIALYVLGLFRNASTDGFAEESSRRETLAGAKIVGFTTHHCSDWL